MNVQIAHVEGCGVGEGVDLGLSNFLITVAVSSALVLRCVSSLENILSRTVTYAVVVVGTGSVETVDCGADVVAHFGRLIRKSLMNDQLKKHSQA